MDIKTVLTTHRITQQALGNAVGLSNGALYRLMAFGELPVKSSVTGLLGGV